MRVYIDLGYGCRCVVDATAAELDTFSKVLDRARPVESGWYGGEQEIKLSANPVQDYALRVVPARIKLVEPAPVAPTPTEQEA